MWMALSNTAVPLRQPMMFSNLTIGFLWLCHWKVFSGRQTLYVSTIKCLWSKVNKDRSKYVLSTFKWHAAFQILESYVRCLKGIYISRLSLYHGKRKLSVWKGTYDWLLRIRKSILNKFSFTYRTFLFETKYVCWRRA